MKAEIDQYLRTGDYDPLLLNWPGQNIGEEDEFADFVVHEAAHVFHNTKRRTLGLPETGASDDT